MRGWLTEQWQQIRGNLKYDVAKYAFLAGVAGMSALAYYVYHQLPKWWPLIPPWVAPVFALVACVSAFIWAGRVLSRSNRPAQAQELDSKLREILGAIKTSQQEQTPTGSSEAKALQFNPLVLQIGELARDLLRLLEEKGPAPKVTGRSDIKEALWINWTRLPNIHDGYMNRFHDRVEKMIYELGDRGIRDYKINDLVSREMHSDADIKLIADKFLDLAAQIIIREYKSAYVGHALITQEDKQLFPIDKKPHLGYLAADSMGLYDLQANIIGFYLQITNDEMRYPSTAHNVKARIRYHHSLGETFAVDGVWTTNDSPRSYSQIVTLPMDGKAYLLLVIWNNSGADYYAPAPPLPPELRNERRLEYGEWSVEITLTSDSVNDTYEGTLLLTEKRGIALTKREQGLTYSANRI